jgi:hypothetical protein
MTKQEEILEGITGYVATDILSIPKNWIYQAMEQYAEWYAQNEPKANREAEPNKKLRDEA